MRAKTKRMLVCVILFSLLLGILSVITGCFSSGSGGVLGGGKKPNERTENEINLSFDAETGNFSFDAVDGAKRYDLHVQAKDSDFQAVMGALNYKDEESQGRQTIHAGSQLTKYQDEFQNGVYLLLTAYGDSFQDKDIIRSYRLACDFLCINQDRVVFDENKLAWDKVEGASSYIVQLNGQQRHTTETQYEITDYLGIGLEFLAEIIPVGGEGLWVSAATDSWRVARVVEPRSLTYRAGAMQWIQGESVLKEYAYQLSDVEYLLTYRDGDEVHEVVQKETSYAYKPKTGNFSFSVKARVSADVNSKMKFMPSQTVEHTPYYYGTAENFNYNQETKTFTWDLDVQGYTLFVDGEKQGFFNENLLRANRFYDGAGIREIRIVPYTNDGYCTDFVTQVRYTQDLSIEAIQTSANGVRMTVSGFLGADSCLVEPSNQFDDAEPFVCEVVNDTAVFEGTIGDGVTEAEGWVRFTPVFNDGIWTVARDTLKTVYHHAETPVQSVSYQGYTPYVEFEANHTLEVELDGEITQVLTGKAGLEGMFKIPLSAFGNKNTESTVTLRVRTLSDHSYGLHMASQWYEVEVRRLAAPQGLRVEEGTAYWNYEGEWSFDGYEFDLQGEYFKTYETQKDILLKEWGVQYLQVKTLADPDLCTPRRWYIDSLACDHYLVEKLAPPQNVRHTVYGLEWDSGETDCYEVLIKAADGVSYEKSFTLLEPALPCTEYLKAYHTLDIWITEKGNDTDLFDGVQGHFVITLNPGFVYSMVNDDIDGEEFSKISWSYFDDTVTYDYYLKDPSGSLIEQKKGVQEGKTSLFRTPEAVGASVLGIKVPASALGNGVFLLKTGEDKYDYWEQKIWKMYAVASVNENGGLEIESFPTFANERISVQVTLGKVKVTELSSKGKWTVDGSKFANAEEGDKWLYIDVMLSRTDCAERLLFFNATREAVYECTVQKAAAPTLSVGEYTAGEKYFSAPTQLDESKTVLPTVYWNAHSTITQGCSYTYKHYSNEGELLSSVTTNRNDYTFTGDVYDDYTIKLNANVFAKENGVFFFYKSSDESEVFEVNAWYDLYTKGFAFEDGVLTVSGLIPRAGDVVQLMIGDNPPVDMPIVSQDGFYATYSYDTGLTAGEEVTVLLWRSGDTENYPDMQASYKCYFTLTVE